jgi:hypothetical protein
MVSELLSAARAGASAGVRKQPHQPLHWIDMTITRVASCAVVAFALSCASTRNVSASTIAVGTAIPLSPTAFALPIEITDAIQLSGWQFDLAYDPSDVQVNTSCDPFSDPYCGFITGPVTEGGFFSSGAPFNLLLPGFIDLDPVTSAQTGSLFAVHGEYGGFPPAPSGDGVLAYVEFITIGTGGSAITVQNPSAVEAPEPGSLMLLTTGLSLLRGRRFLTRHRER